MAALYATQTHRGLQITWTGTDLTGVPGSSLSLIFNSSSLGRRFVGGGTFSSPVISTVNGVVQSQMNYTPAAGDVAPANEGEWRVQVKVVYNDNTVDFSTLSTVEIKLPL